MTRPINWAFLGDSLTEGIGSTRVTFVSELSQLLRQSQSQRAVHDLRLRDVDPATFNPFLKVNLAGYLDADPRPTLPALWMWNLGSEGRTIESDLSWLPLLQNLRPERIYIHRGSLESILRPACFHDGAWPAWVPKGWRGLVSMDPRCYFSDTWWRRLKQTTLNDAKQRVRLRLLQQGTPRPLVAVDTILHHYRALLRSLSELGSTITILGLLPPDAATFPGSAAHFTTVNAQLRALARECGVEFLDWSSDFEGGRGRLFYDDGFHPNAAGNRRLAEILHARLRQQNAA